VFRSFRSRLLAVFLVPTLVLFVAAGATAYAVAQRGMEEELGRSLMGQASALASQLSPERLALLGPGDEATRTYRSLLHSVKEMERSTGARRVLVFDRDGRARVDSAERLPIGTPVPELERDRLELERLFAGRPVASSVLFLGTDGAYYKTGYAPLLQDAQVMGGVAVEGSAAFFAPLQHLSRGFAAWAILALVTLLALALWTSAGSTRPLRRLIASAQRIGAGDLGTPVPRERTREVDSLAQSLEGMRAALEARERQLHMMLAGIAHEVRNPLGGMELFLGLAREEADPEKSRGHLEKLERELFHLNHIVEDFLSFAREAKLSKAPVEMAGLLAEAQTAVALDAQAKQVTMHVEAVPKQLEADPHLLLSAVQNMAKNAVAASPKKGEVTLTGRSEGGRYVVEVVDLGPGVPPADQQRIFEPFFTTKEKGTGLGLPLARKVARAHGGDLTLVPSTQGAHFRLWLPL
jgi:signal transduction histidine kinase